MSSIHIPQVRIRVRDPIFVLWRNGLLWLLTGLFIAACAPMQLSPVTPNMTGRHDPGQIVWHDLLTNDVSGARQFYGRLFGWTFKVKDRYTLVLNEGIPVAGMVLDATAGKKLSRAWWVAYLSIEAVDETARWIEELGGQVIKGPGDMRGRGRYAMVRDPQGAPLVLLRSAAGDPDPAAPRIGGWLWNELWTTDTEAALEFYQPLGSYAAVQVSPATDPHDANDAYWVLMTDERWQAGITGVPFEDVPPQWIPVLRVADATAVAARVPALGGRVLVDPDHPLSDGTVALIEDPAGAILMVESWQPANDAATNP